MTGKIQYTLSPIAAAVTAALVPPATAVAQDEGASGAVIEEIIVTSRKREESMQGIPASIQAIPAEMLEAMGAMNTEDYARFIPSLSFISYTPGSNNVIFRGVTTGVSDFIAQAGASIYLDETSITSTGSQPDVRMVDIARVEALAGPQGTLYGASAQAGIMRIVTNQPDPSQLEGGVDLQMRTGSDSDESYDISAVLNVPLVEDRLAVRLVAFTAEDGGYIDNVFGHTPDTHEWFTLPTGSGTMDNAAVVKDNWNKVEYVGARISLRWDINEDWAATISHNYQNNEASGANDFDPFVGDLQTVKYNPYFREDDWTQTSLTIEADLGFAQLVSATGFFDRTIDYRIDATVYFKYYNAWACNYSLDPVVYYWAWVNPNTGYAVYYPRYCFAPTQQGDFVGVIQGPTFMDKFTQEIRLSNQGEQMDWLLGFYYEDSSDNWDAIWGEPTSNDYQNSLSLVYWESFYGAGFAPTAVSGWFSADRTEWEQKALFGEATWHINDQWSATVGGRYFERTNDKTYWVENPFSNLQPEYQPTPPVASGTDEDFVPKISVSYQISDDKLIYGLYTEGFRPGGTNRGRGDPARTAFPRVFEADIVTNYEIGAKTQWAGGTFQLNVTAFQMEWDDYQLEVVDPSYLGCDGIIDPICGQPWQKVVANAGDAHTSGLQVEAMWVPAEGLDLGMNALWLEAETDEDFPIASITKGLRLPNVAEFKGSVWGTYTWPVTFASGGQMFVRGQYSYTGDSFNQLVPAAIGTDSNPTLTNEAYGIADIRFGLTSGEGNWQVDVFVNNVGDEQADYYNGTGWFEYPFGNTQDGRTNTHRIYRNRPREYGLRFSMNWGR